MTITPLTQVISFAGALLVLLGYAGEQFGWMNARRPVYNVLNAAGAAILVMIALRPFQLGFVVMEGAWVAISIYGLVRALRPRPGA
ncbi:MAG TPA: hypothetical protein VN176_12150 [Verrucomicrobiae bacterium]|jgi:hypothetical protein|nr:hypothetical protein [Verrucomicrobiae bacterium]